MSTDMGAEELINIIDTFTAPSVFTVNEELALVETASSLINDL